MDTAVSSRAVLAALKESPPPDLTDLTSVFFAIHLVGGHIGLPLLVVTFLFSKTAKRHPTIINFCVTWIIYSVIYCLMAVVAGLAVVLQIWTTFLEPWKEARLASVPRWIKLVAIIVPPYLTFIAFSVSAAYYGSTHPEWVGVKNGLYCGLLHGNFEMFAVPVFCSVFLLSSSVSMATIAAWYRGRANIIKDFPLADRRKPSLSPWCRAALFLIYAALTLAACIMDLKQDMNVLGYMVQAALPLAAFLIFGFQKLWLVLDLDVQLPHFSDFHGVDTPIATHPTDSIV
ncbi:uncharacterized protein BXZ73DRAFT_96718 [Epithele typhae]|uniref:uncharacterized protein n=1 Tax=Epithele typhae TaxID=378194 RepID=UPI002008CC84|nr:uncharacterized protein BXZ73DRAFT_96718 [Epithele typhae]KAH9944229.1 hypothetical protein BXZ73DRAFT_96718 [Epithele typhae]